VPTRCRHRGGMTDPYATRPVGQSASRSSIQSNTWWLGPKSSKTSQFAAIRRSTLIRSYTSESYYRSYTVATSGVNRLSCQTCHNRLFRKKVLCVAKDVTSIDIMCRRFCCISMWKSRLWQIWPARRLMPDVSAVYVYIFTYICMIDCRI
jgi:hypothetical protein